MHCGKIKYQGVIFGDFREISPTSERIIKLMELFRDRNLIPSTFQELDTSSLMPITRVSLNSINNEWLLNIGTQRIDIIRNSLDSLGDNLGTAKDFLGDASTMIAKILTEFTKRGSRVALVVEKFLEDNDALAYDNVYRILRKPVDFYASNIPFEWITRDAAKKEIIEENLAETFNVISALARAQGQVAINNEIRSFDRINLSFDINTILENTEARFDANMLTAVLQKALGIQETLEAEILNEISYECK